MKLTHLLNFCHFQSKFVNYKAELTQKQYNNIGISIEKQAKGYLT